ncbi:MAG TPA: tetratricopeptide repeat protein [Reyranella sp.]
MTISSVDLRKTSGVGAGCARGMAGQYHDLMKLIVSALAALLLALSPVAAQTLDADMKKAAAAYERKDMATAARIWKVWAGKGNAEARTLLGAMYWSGEGVPRDHKEAARLYLLAANQGYARAQNDIGFMLGFGEGIPPQDDIEAYKWLTLAINGYTAKNQDRLVQARKDLATLAKRMSPAQITEAERRARVFKPTL